MARCLPTLTSLDFASTREHFLQILLRAVQLAVEGTGLAHEQAIALGIRATLLLGLQTSHLWDHLYLHRPAALQKMLRRQYRESKLLDRLGQ